MKKYGNIILILLVTALFLSGCSYVKASADSDNDNLPELKIGIDASYEPYTYVDENGNYAGLDIELAKTACERMKMKPVFVAIDKWDNKNAYLEDGKIDCIWSCFSINGREDVYDWSIPYMYSRHMVAVLSDSNINYLKDLEGGSVAVMSSTRPESVFLQREGDNIPNIKNLYCMRNMDLVFSSLSLEYVDAIAGHETVLRQGMQKTEGKYRLLDEDLLSAKVGIAFQKGQNEDVLEKLNNTLLNMINDGTLKQTLEKYEISADGVGGGEEQ